MDYCGPAGIPHSQFLAWSQDDQDKALGWLIDKGEKCPGCGTYPDEWLDEDGVPHEEEPYELHDMVCRACMLMGKERKNTPEERTDGVMYFFSRPGTFERKNKSRYDPEDED